MRSINLSKLCMEEDDFALNQEVRCNHGFVVPLKTSWTSTNPGRRYWACNYYRGVRSCDFWCWRDKENINSRSKFAIPKLIVKIGELENLVESLQYNKSTSFNEVRKLIVETSEEVDKPRASKEDDNCVDMKLKKLEKEIEKMKERDKKWRSNMAKGTTKDNAIFIIVFCCCIVVIATSYWFGMIYVRKDSIKLP
ncbi:hypothetical protein P3S68_001536 [Capsicum galapagoense]